MTGNFTVAQDLTVGRDVTVGRDETVAQDLTVTRNLQAGQLVVQNLVAGATQLGALPFHVLMQQQTAAL